MERVNNAGELPGCEGKKEENKLSPRSKEYKEN